MAVVHQQRCLQGVLPAIQLQVYVPADAHNRQRQRQQRHTCRISGTQRRPLDRHAQGRAVLHGPEDQEHKAKVRQQRDRPSLPHNGRQEGQLLVLDQGRRTDKGHARRHGAAGTAHNTVYQQAGRPQLAEQQPRVLHLSGQPRAHMGVHLLRRTEPHRGTRRQNNIQKQAQRVQAVSALRAIHRRALHN